MNYSLRKRGFTLIELIITMFILVIVLGMVASVIQFTTNFFHEENSQLESQNNIRLVGVEFEKDVRKYVDSIGKIQKTTDTPLCYKLGDTITYCLTDKTITRKTGSNDPVIIGESVEEFSVSTNDTNESVTFHITTIDERSMINSIDFTIYLRTKRKVT